MKLYKKEFLIWTQIIFFFTPILFLVNGCGDDDDNGPESPVITSLNPDSGLVGTAVDITGLNFGTNSSVVSVSFGTSSATVNSITATLINVDVPDDLSAGEVTVTVEGRISNEATFEVTEL
ncbi:MAG: IPT/TIG domain-containing protein, partial [Cytophagales bacterium]|nr:IPT/TIG domain-containing protein [Cytophagales bacterium]